MAITKVNLVVIRTNEGTWQRRNYVATASTMTEAYKQATVLAVSMNRKLYSEARTYVHEKGEWYRLNRTQEGDSMILKGLWQRLREQRERRTEPTDAEMLDWLDKQCVASREGQTQSDPVGEHVANNWTVQEQASNVRQAIAMAMKRNQGEPHEQAERDDGRDETESKTT